MTKERKNAAVWVIEYSELTRETWGGLPLDDGECFEWGLPSDRRRPTSLVKAIKTLREWIEQYPPWPAMGWPDYRYRLRHIHTNEVIPGEGLSLCEWQCETCQQPFPLPSPDCYTENNSWHEHMRTTGHPRLIYVETI